MARMTINNEVREIDIDPAMPLLKDPARNGNRSLAELVEHMDKDPLVRWGWSPGRGRSPIPIAHSEFITLLKAGAATGGDVHKWPHQDLGRYPAPGRVRPGSGFTRCRSPVIPGTITDDLTAAASSSASTPTASKSAVQVTRVWVLPSAPSFTVEQ
jgi:hypothetical protein